MNPNLLGSPCTPHALYGWLLSPFISQQLSMWLCVSRQCQWLSGNFLMNIQCFRALQMLDLKEIGSCNALESLVWYYGGLWETQTWAFQMSFPWDPFSCMKKFFKATAYRVWVKQDHNSLFFFQVFLQRLPSSACLHLSSTSFCCTPKRIYVKAWWISPNTSKVCRSKPLLNTTDSRLLKVKNNRLMVRIFCFFLVISPFFLYNYCCITIRAQMPEESRT